LAKSILLIHVDGVPWYIHVHMCFITVQLAVMLIASLILTLSIFASTISIIKICLTV